MEAYQLDAIAKMLEETAIPGWVREYVIDNEYAINDALDAGETVTINGPLGEVIRVSAA